MTLVAKLPLLLTLAGVWLAMTFGAVMLQRIGGAYEGDFGGHPDEGAHFVTGLMVRDYALSGFSQHPMRYAETYYAHYPKVALGHYPPMFYVVEGAWLMLFPVSRASVLVMMAVLCGAFGTMVFAVARERAGPVPPALAVAVLALVLPMTQSAASAVMSDLLVAILVLVSALFFARYLETERWSDSLAFGLFAAAATMTKGSGLFLALLPPMAIVLTGRYRLLAKGSLWVAVLPVVLICGPWLYFSSGITSEGMLERGVLEHLQYALPYFGAESVKGFGLVILIPALVGAVHLLWRRPSQRDAFRVVVFCVPVCLVVFFSAIPAGLEARYLLPAVPPVLMLACWGIGWGVSRCPDRRRGMAGWAMGGVVAGLFLWETFTVPKRSFTGYRASVRELVAAAGGDGRVLKVLVSADARGEGAFVSEMAILDPQRPGHTVERSSKVLSESDWLGRGYQEAFKSDEEMRRFLEESGYDAIFIDESIPEIFLRPHHVRVARVVDSSNVFTRLPDVPDARTGRTRTTVVHVRTPSDP